MMSQSKNKETSIIYTLTKFHKMLKHLSKPKMLMFSKNTKNTLTLKLLIRLHNCTILVLMNFQKY